jgi:hypothetical protein
MFKYDKYMINSLIITKYIKKTYQHKNKLVLLTARARLFKILDKVIHWIKLSTGQLLIQWAASQWIKLVVQKQRQWLARYPLDKMLSSGQLP